MTEMSTPVFIDIAESDQVWCGAFCENLAIYFNEQ